MTLLAALLRLFRGPQLAPDLSPERGFEADLSDPRTVTFASPPPPTYEVSEHGQD